MPVMTILINNGADEKFGIRIKFVEIFLRGGSGLNFMV